MLLRETRSMPLPSNKYAPFPFFGCAGVSDRYKVKEPRARLQILSGSDLVDAVVSPGPQRCLF
jgi:hypothetical protein